MQTVIQYLLFLFTGTLLQAQEVVNDPLISCKSESLYTSEKCMVSPPPFEAKEIEGTRFDICRAETIAMRNIHPL